MAKLGGKIANAGTKPFPCEWVREWRDAHGLSQPAAARLLKQTEATFQNWDRGRSGISEQARKQILQQTSDDGALRDFQERLTASVRGSPPGGKKKGPVTPEESPNRSQVQDSKKRDNYPLGAPSPKDEEAEANLLLLIKRSPDLQEAMRETVAFTDWSATGYPSDDWMFLFWRYAAAGRNSCGELLPRALDHTYFAPEVNSMIAQALFYRICFRHSRNMEFLTETLRPFDRFKTDRLAGKEHCTGYVEARDFLSGDLVPSPQFFRRLEAILHRELTR